MQSVPARTTQNRVKFNINSQTLTYEVGTQPVGGKQQLGVWNCCACGSLIPDSPLSRWGGWRAMGVNSGCLVASRLAARTPRPIRLPSSTRVSSPCHVSLTNLPQLSTLIRFVPFPSPQFSATVLFPFNPSCSKGVAKKMPPVDPIIVAHLCWRH